MAEGGGGWGSLQFIQFNMIKLTHQTYQPRSQAPFLILRGKGSGNEIADIYADLYLGGFSKRYSLKLYKKASFCLKKA